MGFERGGCNAGERQLIARLSAMSVLAPLCVIAPWTMSAARSAAAQM